MTAGSRPIGFADVGGRPHRLFDPFLETLGPGDLVGVPPGETHWRGAGPYGYLPHLATSLHWGRPVTDEEHVTVRPRTIMEEQR